MNRALAALLALLCTLAAVRPIGAQPQTPDPFTDSAEVPATPAYDRAREVLDLINAADGAAYRRFVEQAFAPGFKDAMPMTQHASVYDDLIATSGKLTLHGARSYTPPHPATNAVLVVRSELTEQWRAIVVDVEDEPPHRISRIQVLPARPPSNLPKGERLTDEQLAEQLGAFVDRTAKREVFSGAVLLAKDGKPLMIRAAGLANRDFDAPNRPDTKFNLGSMNKMFTAVAILQLAEQGKLSLDDTLSKHLDPSWLSSDILEKVTIKHLLTHSSGLGSYFNEDWDRSSRALYRKVNDYKPLVVGETLAFEPGSRTQYSNTGFLILGAVVEKAGGMDYFEYVRRHITGPAGMVNTDCYELDKVNPNLAVGYERRPSPSGPQYKNNIFMHVIRGGPAGGGYSTVEDLLRFDQALRSGKLLTKKSLDAAWSPYPDLHSPTYGLGFALQQTPAGKVVGHSGGFAGINAYLSMYLDAGYTVTVLSNLDSGASLVEAKARELITQGR
jgi:CubicO group peptidase (beta-lactamase class C family)